MFYSNSSSSIRDLTGLVVSGDEWLSFRLKSLLGTGGFSHVYLGEHIWTGILFAIKCIPISNTDRDSLTYAEAEADLHSQLTSIGHPNVIDLVYTFIAGDYMFFVLEYADGGDLWDFLASDIPSESTLKHIFQQVVDAIAFCHSAGIAHRDIKPENFVLKDDNVCLTDFGLASANRSGTTHNIGTTSYMSPECLGAEGRYDYNASDAWSVGIVFLYILTGKLPWSQPSPDDADFAAFCEHPYIWLGVHYPWLSEDVLDILIHLLALEPTSRMTISGLQDTLRNVDKFFSDNRDVITETIDELPNPFDNLCASFLSTCATTATYPVLDENDALFHQDGCSQDNHPSIPIDPVYSSLLEVQWPAQYSPTLNSLLMSPGVLAF